MSKPNHTLPQNYFTDVYRNNEDPWNFETSDYEKAKYAATINALPKPVYQEAFEVGCSIGVLTAMLAARCKQLLAVDSVEEPLVKARKRLEKYSNVTIKQMAVPGQFPSGMFDLILVSEVGYYLSLDDLHKFSHQIITHLQKGGHLLLVHWTPEVPDYPLTGDEVHEWFMTLIGDGKPLKHLHHQREEKYRLDLFELVNVQA